MSVGVAEALALRQSKVKEALKNQESVVLAEFLGFLASGRIAEVLEISRLISGDTDLSKSLSSAESKYRQLTLDYKSAQERLDSLTKISPDVIEKVRSELAEMQGRLETRTATINEISEFNKSQSSVLLKKGAAAAIKQIGWFKRLRDSNIGKGLKLLKKVEKQYGQNLDVFLSESASLVREISEHEAKLSSLKFMQDDYEKALEVIELLDAEMSGFDVNKEFKKALLGLISHRDFILSSALLCLGSSISLTGNIIKFGVLRHLCSMAEKESESIVNTIYDLALGRNATAIFSQLDEIVGKIDILAGVDCTMELHQELSFVDIERMILRKIELDSNISWLSYAGRINYSMLVRPLREISATFDGVSHSSLGVNGEERASTGFASLVTPVVKPKGGMSLVID